MSDLLSVPVRSELAGVDDEHAKSQAIEVLRPTLPTPLSALIATLFGHTKNLSRGPVLFTSTEHGAGVTWTASAVAAELAASGRKVLLAEAGVVASISTREDVVTLCDQVGSDQVWVLGAEQARRSPYPFSFVSSEPAVTISVLREEFPYIILDAPSLSKSDIALRLASLVAGSVLVVRENETEKRAVKEASQRFNTVGGQVLGCVYNAYSGERQLS